MSSETPLLVPKNEIPFNDNSFNKIALCLFCILAFWQAASFGDWNPISNSALAAFPTWSINTIAWQVNFATFTSPFLQWPLWKAIQNYKFENVLKIGACLPMFIGALLRSLSSFFPVSSQESLFTASTFLCSFCTGVAGLVFYSSLTKFSTHYAVSSSRSFVIGAACMAANLGAIAPALIGPAIVTDPTSSQWNSEELAKEIHNYLLLFSIGSFLLLLVFVLSFPKVSFETSQDTHSLMFSLSTILKNVQVLSLLYVHSCCCIPLFWSSSFLTIYLSASKFEEKSVGILIVSSVLLSIVVTTILSKCVDYKIFHLKTLIIVLISLYSTGNIILVVTLLSYNSQYYLIAFSYIVSNSLGYTIGPFLLSYGSLLGRPISEEFVCGLFFQTSCLLGASYLFLFSLEHPIETALYPVMICPTLSLLPLLCLKDN